MERRDLTGIEVTERSAAGSEAPLAGGQQHFAQTRPTQHDRPWPWASVFAVEADASPTAENVPTIAARTIQESRRW